MQKLLLGACCLLLTAAGASHALAEDDKIVTGELHITMNSDYATVQVNGEDWEAVEFARKGKVAIVKQLPLDEESEVTLKPSYDNLEPVTFTVQGKDFKKARVKGGYVMKAAKNVKFPVRKGDAAPKPSTPDKPVTPVKPKPDDGQDL